MPYTRLIPTTPPVLFWEPVRSLSLNRPSTEPLGRAQVPELQHNHTFQNHHDRRRDPLTLHPRPNLLSPHDLVSP